MLEISKILKRSKSTIYRFINDPMKKRKIRNDKGKERCLNKQEKRKIVRSLKKNPNSSSTIIFTEAKVSNVSKSSRNRFLRKIAHISSPKKQPLLTERHKILRLEWAKKYETGCKCCYVH